MDVAANVLSTETAAEQSSAYEPRLWPRVKSDDYRRIVSRIILEIEAEKDWNDEQLAEEVGCSRGTIKNARLKKGNLDPVTMLNLGACCGGYARLKPVFALINGCPVDPPTLSDRLDRIDAESRAIRAEISA